MDEVCTRVYPDCDEKPFEIKVCFGTVQGVVEPDSNDFLVAIDAFNSLVEDELDLRVVKGPVLHGLARTKCAVTVNHVDLVRDLVRKVASSTAESPPPTTVIVLLRKKKPSHMAHHETPWPFSRSSSGMPSLR